MSNNKHTDINELDKAKLLWDEYKYRHEHCWQNLYKLTAAALALSIVPYIKDNLAAELGYWLVIPPIISTILIAASIFRIYRELKILDEIRSNYRQIQKDLSIADNTSQTSMFSLHVWIFVITMLTFSAMNVIVVTIWITGRVFC